MAIGNRHGLTCHRISFLTDTPASPQEPKRTWARRRKAGSADLSVPRSSGWALLQSPDNRTHQRDEPGAIGVREILQRRRVDLTRGGDGLRMKGRLRRRPA
ncbi:MAG: hypothetical protein ACTS3R_01890 [Inquilinaceae bacterium]